MLRFRMQCDGIAIGVLETEKAPEWPVLKARKYLNSSGEPGRSLQIIDRFGG